MAVTYKMLDKSPTIQPPFCMTEGLA